MSNASLEKGGGDVTGPGAGASTDEAIVRWDGTTGQLIQDSVATLTDAGVSDGITQLNVDNLRLDGLTLSSTNTNGNIVINPDGTGVVNVNCPTFKVEESIDAGVTIMRVFNPSSTNAEARIRTTVGVGSAGDPYLTAEINTQRSYCWGIDSSDSETLKMNTNPSTSVSPSTGTNLWNLTTAGENTIPLQPAFMANLETSDANVTGDGTTFTVGMGNALTERFDQGGDFNVNGTFTAPVTGKYQLNANIMVQGMTAGTNTMGASIQTSNRTFNLGTQNGCFSGNNSSNLHQLADMDTSDTATMRVAMSGGALDVTVFGGDARTNFSGFLAC